MKERALRCFKYICIILIIGIAYGLFVMYTGIGIPCIFKLITGYECPGCGVSRMCMSLMKLDFKAAYNYNKVLFILSPFLILLFALNLYRYIRYNDSKMTKVQSTILYIAIALLLLWGIARNIPLHFSFLMSSN